MYTCLHVKNSLFLSVFLMKLEFLDRSQKKNQKSKFMKMPPARAELFHTDRPTDIYGEARGEFRPRQTRQLPRAVDLKGRLLSCQSY